jgi:hypothetical protein
MTHKTLFLIILLSIFLFLYNLFNSNTSFAISPFIREEVRDELNDVYDLTTCFNDYNICRTASNTLREVASIDIEGASYVSDGRFINTSLWVNNPTINSKSMYIIFIDVDSNPETGGGDGAEYMIQLSYDKTLKKWVKELHERSDFDRSKSAENFGLITKEIRENSSITDPIHIDVDLKDLNFPKFFDMVFYTTTTAGPFEDHTSWIHIPPPEIQISFSENPLNIRPSETKTVYALINSSTGLEPVIQLVPGNTTSNIEWKLMEKNQSIKLPAYGTTTIPIKFYAKNVTAGEQFFFPIFAKSSFPFKSFRSEFKDINSDSKPIVDTTHRSNLVIYILNPIEPHEHVKKFVENWFNPLTGVYQTASGIMGGIAGYILAKFKSKKTNSDKI